MSTIDTGLKNLNIWEGTLEQIENNRAEIGINDFALATDVSFEEQFRFSVMPPAIEANVGKVVQYIGGDTETYKTGSYYKCVQELSYIDTIEADGCTATMTNRTLFEEVCINRSSTLGRRIDYWELTPRDDATGTSQACSIKGYNKNGTYLSTLTNTSLSAVEGMFGVKTTGSVGLNTKIRFYRGTPYVQNPAATVTPSDTEIISSYSIDVYQLMIGYLVPNDLENENQTIVLTYNGDDNNWYNGDTVVGGASLLFSLYGVYIGLSGSLYDGITLTINYTAPIEGYTWVMIESGTSVGFEEVVGNPRDNEALNSVLTELTQNIENDTIIQVDSLPEITEENYNKVYQYVGDDSPTEGLFKGSFYVTKGAQWEYDVENSYLVDDIQFEVFDESKFLSFFVNAILTTYPTATYFDFCFDDGASTSPIRLDAYLDPSISSERYWRDNAMNLGYYAGAIIRGTPTRTSDKTTCTRLRINISTIDSYENWTWIPVSLYPEPKANKFSLYNISVNNTSLIEHACHYQLNDNAANTVLIGVNARNDYYTDIGNQTAVGYNAHVSIFGTAIGCNADAYGNSIAIGTNARTNGETCIVIGTNNVANERSLVIGPSCLTQARYSSAIGYDSKVQSNGEKAVALGYKAVANAEGAIQLGEGTNPSNNTLQFRNYTLVDSNGVIPSSRLSAYSPEDDYVLAYDEELGEARWKSLSSDIPVIQVTEMPEAEEGMVVQYIGDDDGELIKGYWYEAVYDTQGDYWYWNQINVQPEASEISYDNLTDKPSIDGVTIEGDLNLVEDFGLARVAQTGSYADLTTKPGINGHALLANTTAAELQISYNDLIDKPVDPTTQLPDLPEDKDNYDYMLKWDHVQGKLVWYRATDAHEDLGVLPEPTNE